jgi:hypothetical protein
MYRITSNRAFWAPRRHIWFSWAPNVACSLTKWFYAQAQSFYSMSVPVLALNGRHMYRTTGNWAFWAHRRHISFSWAPNVALRLAKWSYTQAQSFYAMSVLILALNGRHMYRSTSNWAFWAPRRHISFSWPPNVALRLAKWFYAQAQSFCSMSVLILALNGRHMYRITGNWAFWAHRRHISFSRAPNVALRLAKWFYTHAQSFYAMSVLILALNGRHMYRITSNWAFWAHCRHISFSWPPNVPWRLSEWL